MATPIAVFDIDGTIFRSSLLIEVIRKLVDGGVFPAEIEQQYQQEYGAWLNREGSYDEYLGRLIEAFLHHIKGVSTEQLAIASDAVIASSAKHTYRYTRDLINQLHKTHFLVAISASPEELVARFAKAYDFKDYRATKYVTRNGLYTGAQGLIAKHNKDLLVKEIVAKHNLTLKGSIGVGDSESDIPMLAVVDKPIAFNPNSVLFTEATKRNWQVVVERKDVIYYYNRD